MKKVAALLIVVAMIFTVVGCQMDSEVPTPGEENMKEYKSSEGWAFLYPSNWDRVEADFVQESSSGKTISFRSGEGSEAELEEWIDSEVVRKLLAEEAENTLVEPITTEEMAGGSVLYRYTIESKGDNSKHLLPVTIFYNGKQWVELQGSIPPMTSEEYQVIINSFKF